MRLLSCLVVLVLTVSTSLDAADKPSRKADFLDAVNGCKLNPQDSIRFIGDQIEITDTVGTQITSLELLDAYNINVFAPADKVHIYIHSKERREHVRSQWHGKRPTQQDELSLPSLHNSTTCTQKVTDALKLLVEAYSFDPLQTAIIEGNIQRVSDLMSRNYPVNEIRHQTTPLIQAADWK